MHAQIEWAERIVESFSAGRRRQPARPLLLQQCLPLFERLGMPGALANSDVLVSKPLWKPRSTPAVTARFIPRSSAWRMRRGDGDSMIVS